MSRAATAARAGVILAVSVVALQVLQQVLDAFDPRRSLAVAITVAFAAATFALDRLNQRRHAVAERDSRLGAALCHWPLPRVAELEPRRLGVFPARLRDGRPMDGAYVPRSLDAALRAAVRPGQLVLLLGPSRSGKSRTAYEALARNAWLIAPRDAAGLRAAATVDPPPG